MSDYASIVERARKSFAAVSRLEAELERDPSSAGIQINLAAAKKQAIQNQDRLLALSKERHVEVCNYRLLPEATSHYGVAHVSGSLLSYQNLFSQIHDAKKNGPKQKAQVNPGAARESSLDFAYSYSGSLGVVLLVQNERDFFSGLLDSSIDALFTVLHIDSQSTVREMMEAMGAAVVKRAHDWSETNLNAGFATDIRWNKSDGRQLGEVIECRRMERLVDVLKQSSDETIRPIEANGVLIGGNIENKAFHFVVPNGESYKGRQAEDFRSTMPLTLGNRYRATIREKKKIFYATEQETVVYELVSLSESIPDGNIPTPSSQPE